MKEIQALQNSCERLRSDISEFIGLWRFEARVISSACTLARLLKESFGIISSKFAGEKEVIFVFKCGTHISDIYEDCM